MKSRLKPLIETLVDQGMAHLIQPHRWHQTHPDADPEWISSVIADRQSRAAPNAIDETFGEGK